MSIPLSRFHTPDSVAAWHAIGDAVMGGVSAGQMTYDPRGHAVFSGEVSLANHGGFASVRSPLPSSGCTHASAYLLTVRGDGKRYKFCVRTGSGSEFDGVDYQQPFAPPDGEWATVRLSTADFVPTRRGRFVDNAAALEPARTRQVGFVIADRQAGAFRLEIRAIDMLA